MREDSKDVDDDGGANVAAATLEDLKGSEGGKGRGQGGRRRAASADAAASRGSVSMLGRSG